MKRSWYYTQIKWHSHYYIEYENWEKGQKRRERKLVFLGGRILFEKSYFSLKYLGNNRSIDLFSHFIHHTLHNSIPRESCFFSRVLRSHEIIGSGNRLIQGRGDTPIANPICISLITPDNRIELTRGTWRTSWTAVLSAASIRGQQRNNEVILL